MSQRKRELLFPNKEILKFRMDLVDLTSLADYGHCRYDDWDNRNTTMGGETNSAFSEG